MINMQTIFRVAVVKVFLFLPRLHGSNIANDPVLKRTMGLTSAISGDHM